MTVSSLSPVSERPGVPVECRVQRERSRRVTTLTVTAMTKKKPTKKDPPGETRTRPVRTHGTEHANRRKTTHEQGGTSPQTEGQDSRVKSGKHQGAPRERLTPQQPLSSSGSLRQ